MIQLLEEPLKCSTWLSIVNIAISLVDLEIETSENFATIYIKKAIKPKKLSKFPEYRAQKND